MDIPPISSSSTPAIRWSRYRSVFSTKTHCLAGRCIVDGLRVKAKGKRQKGKGTRYEHSKPPRLHCYSPGAAAAAMLPMSARAEQAAGSRAPLSIGCYTRLFGVSLEQRRPADAVKAAGYKSADMLSASGGAQRRPGAAAPGAPPAAAPRGAPCLRLKRLPRSRKARGARLDLDHRELRRLKGSRAPGRHCRRPHADHERAHARAEVCAQSGGKTRSAGSSGARFSPTPLPSARIVASRWSSSTTMASTTRP